ncbi:hypothetical protein [Moritella sp.]|uniref:hypothetical protein n=1 Tax=Moritella sp. TaxID=78556 RepID=UPI0025D154B2|nr:hypothetical protein [Moritella sp.]MCJ8352000.1 hypothetical protein [Moritella sp.]
MQKWNLCALIIAAQIASISLARAIELPWQQAENKPTVLPFEVPRLHGKSESFKRPVDPLTRSPLIDTDSIYYAALNCYPEQSTFKISVDLVAGYKANTDQFNDNDWPDITDHYIGIVAKMPIYDTTDRSRSRDREYNRRVKTAAHVAGFAQALANRNYAYREIGIYIAMEARAQARVSQGIVGVDEQIKYLEKTAGAQRNIIKTTAEATEHRLALVAMCDSEKSSNLNNYLVNVANLPSTVQTQ